ncbi:MAG: SDR family NAD(P)-dependent oxidoreductase [Xanthomonadales bacterium]|nr:SDR family NAD(P)-dependent oxidoreductase [Xanthomonadales bacterium]
MHSTSDFSPPADALSGRVVLVTGAHGGLGAAAALAAAKAGATVVLLGRRVPKLNRLYDRLVETGAPEPAIYPLDLEGATPANYEEMAQRIEAECGRLDGILHAAADFQGLTPLALTAPEDWLRAIHVNLSAPLLLTQACLPLLKRAEDAAVVFVEEPLAQVGRAYWGGYGVAKHGLAGLVGVLRHEYEGTSVRVVALQPGPMRTPLRQRAWSAEDPAQWPNPDAYAPACVHLLSGAASPAPDDGGVLLVRH